MRGAYNNPGFVEGIVRDVCENTKMNLKFSAPPGKAAPVTHGKSA